MLFVSLCKHIEVHDLYCIRRVRYTMHEKATAQFKILYAYFLGLITLINTYSIVLLYIYIEREIDMYIYIYIYIYIHIYIYIYIYIYHLITIIHFN